MSLENFSVELIEDKKILKPWLLKKHYAKRTPPIKYAFGLYDGSSVLCGVVTYGPPSSPQVGRGFLGEENRTKVIELNRLCINSNSPPNSASFLVGKSLKSLPKCCIVSYADEFKNHKGYIYQATNFLYCGAVKSHDNEYFYNGKWTHARSMVAKGITAPGKFAKENNILTRPPYPKHRYVFFTDKKLKKYLRYEVLPYPKGETKRYKCPDIIEGKVRNRRNS